MSEKTFICPNCKGKGHVLDGAGTIAGMPIVWVMALFERNDPNGLTREECGTCDGEGFIYPKKKDKGD